MNRRLLHIAFFLFTALYSSGQEFSGSSNTYLNVYSYDGAVSTEAYRLRFQYTGIRLNVPNWKISMRIKGPIVSSDGKVFPPEKISLVPVRTEGQANNPGPLPTLSQIGVASPVTLNGLSEVFLVPSSNTPLYNVSQYSTYYDLKIIFDLVVAGGAYLTDLQEWRQFVVPFRFTAYRSDNSIIGVYDQNYTIQVHKLSGTPPPDDKVFSIQVAALNALLEFNTVSDYIKGKSATYSNGLSVTSNTRYEVQVYATSGNFLSNAGKTLPLDAVNLQLDGTNATNMPEISLSISPQTILEGESTGGVAQHFGITYFTEPNDQRLFAVPPDNYSTTITYQIIAK